MSELEDKEKDLNKLKAKADALLKSNHPASDKIEVKTDPVIRNFRPLLSLNKRPFFSPQAYRDTLQTQWSWLLQITKCIDTHLKENAAYSQVT